MQILVDLNHEKVFPYNNKLKKQKNHSQMNVNRSR
jgi:hypothetical protein